MTKSEYIEEWKKRCRAEWFKDHVATTILNRPEVIIINWQKPGTWNYGCRFIIHRHWLCVMGDIGEATFEWGQDVTTEFLGSLDFGYFMSKCRAAMNGRKDLDFDNAVGYTAAQEWLRDAEDETAETYAAIREIESNTPPDEVERIAREIYDDTGDSELAGMITDWFEVPSTHSIGMFVGLQMAIEQLKKAA